MFDAFPSYDPYRSLRLRDPAARGEDVFALQTVLVVKADGIFGPLTSAAVEQAQAKLRLAVDGIAGPATWAALVNAAAKAFRDEYDVATGLLYGQLAHESSLRGGMFSPQRPDHTYDAGVAQRNTAHTPPEQGFDVPGSIDALAKNDRDYFELFEGLTTRRRWELAAGAWNAPAFACWIARSEGATRVSRSRTAQPSAGARALLDDYIASATAYLR